MARSGGIIKTCSVWRTYGTVHGNTIYMDGVASGQRVMNSMHIALIQVCHGMADINSNGDSVPGERMSVLIGDTIIFDADDGVHDRELWAHNVLTNTTGLLKISIRMQISHS